MNVAKPNPKATIPQINIIVTIIIQLCKLSETGKGKNHRHLYIKNWYICQDVVNDNLDALTSVQEVLSSLKSKCWLTLEFQWELLLPTHQGCWLSASIA